MKKIGKLNGRHLVLGNENELSAHQILVSVKNDTINLKERVNGKIKEISGGSKGAMKYYDCIMDGFREEWHGFILVDNVKALSMEDNSTIIAPEPDMIAESSSIFPIAVAIDTENRRCYINGEWMTMKEYAQIGDGFNPDTHMEITEEEFYHIPEDVVIERGDQEALGKVFETINKYALPVTREPLNVPLAVFGYKTLIAGYSPTTTQEKTNLFWVRRNVRMSEARDSWYDGLEEDARMGTVDAFALGQDYSVGIGKITFDDGTSKYGYFNYILDDED
jgi:hypothetical protein